MGKIGCTTTNPQPGSVTLCKQGDCLFVYRTFTLGLCITALILMNRMCLQWFYLELTEYTFLNIDVTYKEMCITHLWKCNVKYKID